MISIGDYNQNGTELSDLGGFKDWAELTWVQTKIFLKRVGCNYGTDPAAVKLNISTVIGAVLVATGVGALSVAALSAISSFLSPIVIAGVKKLCEEGLDTTATATDVVYSIPSYMSSSVIANNIATKIYILYPGICNESESSARAQIAAFLRSECKQNIVCKNMINSSAISKILNPNSSSVTQVYDQIKLNCQTLSSIKDKDTDSGKKPTTKTVSPLLVLGGIALAVFILSKKDRL